MLGLGLSLAARRGAFSPRSLFAAGEVGAWYDPSDLSTLFQDSAGTTPVTAPGQVVGLVLDKSRGLTLGSEVVTNGGFDTADAWSLVSGVSIAGGVLAFDGTTSFSTSLILATNTPAVSVVAGRSYRVTYTINGGTTNLISVNLGGTAGTTRSAAGTYTEIIVAGGTTGVQVMARGAAGIRTGSIDNISVRELPGNHAAQSGATSVRPIYRVDANGRPYLEFDGIDDWLQTNAINFSATDKMTIFAGVRKLSDAAQACVLAVGAGAGAPGVNNEQGLLLAPGAAAANTYYWRAAGTLTGVQANATGYTAPHSGVLSAEANIATDLQSLRVNGAAAVLGSGDLGTGAFGSGQIIYIGRRSGTSLPFNGNLYGLIVRGAASSASQISNAERWMNRKTGAF